MAGRLDVAIVSNLEVNPGTKPCFSAETLAARLWKKLRRPEEYICIEHRRSEEDGVEQFEEVVFQAGIESISPYKRPRGGTLFAPGWVPVTREQVEELIGGAPEK